MSAKNNPMSRWLRNGPVPRYSDEELVRIDHKYRPQPGWRNGARIRKP